MVPIEYSVVSRRHQTYQSGDYLLLSILNNIDILKSYQSIVANHSFTSNNNGSIFERRSFNEDGSEHDCKSKSKNGNENGNKRNDISVEILLKRLEFIGITIDLEKLRNAKIWRKEHIVSHVGSGSKDLISAHNVEG